ncbi:MAG: NADH-quinone oxidoreductase subunit J [Deltaproteobacteria bacterium]|nr:NADH-quinone oxidoreductase subunit J [Deltaproteobacteria bacterium]
MSWLPMVPFALLASALLACAWCVVTSDDLVHSVLWLALTLVVTAGVYVQLQAEFIAAVQVLLYAGGVAVLMIFAVLLTKRLTGERIPHESGNRVRAALASLSVFGLLTAFILRMPASYAQPAQRSATKVLGERFLVDYALPFEVLSVLLVATMIGAIVIARKEDA